METAAHHYVKLRLDGSVLIQLRSKLVNAIKVNIYNFNLVCGNGIINAGEVCDDGNQISGDGCTNCLIDAGYYCSGAICTKYCGNSVIDGA